MVGHRPADDQPGEQVLDVREVQEPLPGRDVGDVRRPRQVRAVGRKSRSTRSAAGVTPGSRTVVRRRLRGRTPEIPAAFISRSTRFRPTRIPCSRRSSAWIRRAPYVPSELAVDLA